LPLFFLLFHHLITTAVSCYTIPLRDDNRIMKIEILGAHNTESRDTRLPCLLIDDAIALDAGSLTSSLSFEQQMNIKAILLTHGHYDHLCDIPTLGLNLLFRDGHASVCTHNSVLDMLTKYLLNGDIYPDFFNKPEDNPTFYMKTLEYFKPEIIENYSVLPLPVKHSIPACGYLIEDRAGKTIFYTGDTGTGLSEIWQHIDPDIIFIETTASNKQTEQVRNNGHLTPELLCEELSCFQEVKSYLPKVITLHMDPALEPEIIQEIAEMSARFNADIETASEGMVIYL
jgi:ribonuclease BN (tRNA processing enzyme)